MKKIIRILGLIQLIRQKQNYSRAIRRELISTLLQLEYKSYVSKQRSGKVRLQLFNFKILAYDYENLRLLFTEIFVHEEYQYFRNVTNKTIIADCGANIGMATLYLKWKFPGCIIHAFEPDPMAFAALTQNVNNNNLAGVFLHNVAVMDKAGALEFFVSETEQASLMMSTYSKRMNERKIQVQGIDFSAFVAETRPSLLKIDIEGAEKNVVDQLYSSGGLGNFHEIIMEYHHKMDGQSSNLSEMLLIFEKSGFEYNIITRFDEPGKFQDVLIYAFQPALLGHSMN